MDFIDIKEGNLKTPVLHGKYTVQFKDGKTFTMNFEKGMYTGLQNYKSPDGNFVSELYQKGVLNGQYEVKTPKYFMKGTFDGTKNPGNFSY